MITHDDLLNLIEKIVTIAKTEIIPKLTPHEDLAPCLFVTDSEQDIIGIAQIEVPNEYEKRLHLDAVLRQRLHEMQAGAYAMTMMGWVVELSREQSKDNWPKPAQHPDRVEMFIVSAGSRTAYTSKLFKVKRNATHRIYDLEDKTLGGDGSTFGLFIDMLATTPPNTRLV